MASYSAEPGRKARYSEDLRWGMVWQRYGMELPLREIAKRLCVALSTVYSVTKTFEATGEVTKERSGRREDLSKLNSHEQQIVLAMVFDNPTTYLHEICKDVCGVAISQSILCRVLQKYGLTRKKMRSIALQRSDDKRMEFMARVLVFRREMLVFVDETGSDARNYVRKFGYSLRGTRAECHQLLTRGQRITAIAAMDANGVIDVSYTTGTTNADFFTDFVCGTLLPNLQSFDGMNSRSVVIMDNCAIHHVHNVKQLFESAGVLLFLPPYSPNYNPIEELFSYIKGYLKEHEEILQIANNVIPILESSISKHYINSL